MPIDKVHVRKELKRFKLGDYEDLVLESLEPAVRIFTEKPAKKPLPAGTSKFGGEPDLPSPDAWPIHSSGRPMHFLGQICLSKLPAKHLGSTALPQQGWLWFWYDKLGQWFEDNTRLPASSRAESFCVTFEADPKAKLERCAFPEFPEPKIPKAKKLRSYEPPRFTADPQTPIRFEAITTIANSALQQLFKKAERDDPDNGWERTHAFYQAIHLEKKGQPIHRLLGPYLNDGTPPKKPWRLLALLDSDYKHLGWMWGDGGEAQFWIREGDLAKRNFSRIRPATDSA